MGLGFVFLVGLGMAFNPRSLAVVPVVVGYIAADRETSTPKRAFVKTMAFVLGMTVADVLLGVLFALIGSRVSAVFGPKWEFVIGVALLVLGLRWLNILKFRTIGFNIKMKKTTSIVGAFFLGVPFSMSFCPFCVPVVLSILTIAAATGHVWYSALLMLFFSLGRGLPLLAAGMSIGVVKRMAPLQRYVPLVEKIAGVVLLIMSIYYLYDVLRLYLTTVVSGKNY